MEVVFMYPILSCVLVYFLINLNIKNKFLIFLSSIPLQVSIYLHTQNFEVFTSLILIISFLFPLDKKKDEIFYYSTIIFSYFVFVSDSFNEIQILSFFYFIYMSLLYKKITPQSLIYFFLNIFLFFNMGSYRSDLGLGSLATLFVLNDIGVGIFFIIILITSRQFNEHLENENNIAFVSTFILPIIYFQTMKSELTTFLIEHKVFICMVFGFLIFIHFFRFLKNMFNLKNENDLYFISFFIFVFAILKSLSIYELIFLELVLFLLKLKRMDKTLYLIAILIANFVLGSSEKLNYLVILLSLVISYRLLLIPIEKNDKGALVEAL